MAPVQRLEEAGLRFTRNSVGARPHNSPIIPALCRILTPAYYSKIYARIITAALHTGLL